MSKTAPKIESVTRMVPTSMVGKLVLRIRSEFARPVSAETAQGSDYWSYIRVETRNNSQAFKIDSYIEAYLHAWRDFVGNV